MLGGSERVYGPAHPWLATVHLNLGLLYLTRDRLAEAEAALRASLAVSEAVAGHDPSALRKALHALAKVSTRRGRPAEALARLERVAGLFAAVEGERSPELAAVLLDVGRAHHALGQHDEAAAAYARAEAIYAALYPDGHRHLGGLHQRRCELLVDARRWVEAVDACARALEVADRFDLRPAFRAEVLGRWAAAERGRGRPAAAARLEAERAGLVGRDAPVLNR